MVRDGVDGVDGDVLSRGLRRDLQWLVEYASAFAPSASADKSAGPAFGRDERSLVRSVLERLDELWALAEFGILQRTRRPSRPEPLTA